MRKIVGIVPSAKLFETDDLYQDSYNFVNSYALRVYKNGGLPLGLLAVDGLAPEEAFARCDALLICGGRRIHPYHFQAVRHAVQTGKPLLGVCLGLQTIHSYFIVEDEARRRGYAGDLLELYQTMKRERYMFTLPVEHHWDVHMVRGREDEAKHAVTIAANTRLRALLGAETIMGASMHHYRIGEPSARLTVSARAADGTVEGLEYGDRILGVQFHPEVDDECAALFRFLTA